jgi:protein-S-isoprenylcysteine O-methyltransferase Ste14
VSSELLRVAAFVAYLAALVVVGGAALFGMTRGQGMAGGISLRGTVGTLLQLGAAVLVTRSIPEGALRPQAWELVGILILAPASAWLFVWAQVPAARSEGGLVTGGAYGWVRHPMYLAFLGLLVATGLVLSAGWPLLGGVAVYLAGTELRIAVEEDGLVGYAEYRRSTPWRYSPWLR